MKSSPAPEPFLDQKAHARLDKRLNQLRQLLHPSESYQRLTAEAREIIESVKGSLLRDKWEECWHRGGWDGGKFIGSAWFSYYRDRETGKLIEMERETAKSLHAVFTEMVRFVLDATSDYLQDENATKLKKKLFRYLSHRGFKVMKQSAKSHRDGPEAGCRFWWQEECFPIPAGQRYKFLNFMWGRESVSFDDLVDKVFSDRVSDGAVKTAVNRLNNALMGITGFPRKLTTDGTNRIIRWEKKT